MVCVIKFENRFDEYSYRVATRYIDPSVTRLEEGQWVTLNDQGKVVISDGSSKSFIATGSKREGRDQVGGRAVQKVSYLHGVFELSVDNFDPAGDYASNPITPLKVVAGGILAPWNAGDGAEKIEAYAIGQPSGGYLRIFSN